MEQMYLIEIFIDKVYIFASEENVKSGANKSLIIKIQFGPKIQFIIKEGQLAKNDVSKDDIIECDDQGHRKWGRTIRVGKSYLFPSYPDTVLLILEKFPLEIEVWNDDKNEKEIFVGVGTMHWDTEFFHMLKETANASPIHTPLSVKTVTTLMAECCCKQVGEISFILRLSALGDSIITEFQQLMKTPDSFVFRTNKAPSMFECKRIEGDDPNFCMVGSLYETTTLEDPDVVGRAHQKIEVCTELQNCGATVSEHICPLGTKGKEEPKKNKYPIDKIKMGDIHGPCGNSNCPLAHKVRNYIRTLETYKKEAAGKVKGPKDANVTKKICGGCCCKDDRHHRGECPESYKTKSPTSLCKGCDGKVPAGQTCEDRKKKLYGTGVTQPGSVPGSKTQVAYVFSVHHVPDYKESIFGRNFIEKNLGQEYNEFNPIYTQEGHSKPTCGCRKPCMAQVKYSDASCGPNNCTSEMLNNLPSRSIRTNNPTIYNIEVNKEKEKENFSPYRGCTDIGEEKDCKCSPPKPSAPCRTFDCDCIAEIGNTAARKKHKSYCPLYKHKNNCPVTMMNEEEEVKEDDEDVAEPLPYGLPPIQLGPCPIVGRPCSVPDGFARMYKNAVQPTLPPSYSEAGKVCCSKEYERIRKALKDYLKYEKDNEWRCINRFNEDTERRCCDKEQRLFSLMGKACCGSHKMAIREKFKDLNKK